MKSKLTVKSWTIQGLVVAAIGWLVSVVGLPIGEAEQAELAGYVIGAGGLIWAAVGRWRTKGERLTLLPESEFVPPQPPASFPKDKAGPSGLLVLFLACALTLAALGAVLPGCAEMQKLTLVEKASVLGDQMAQAYYGLHDQYLDARATASDSLAARMDERVAPVMDKARRGLIQYLNAVIVWRVTQEQPANAEALRLEVQRLLNDLSSVIAEIVTEGAA